MKKLYLTIALLLMPSVCGAADQTYFVREDKTHNVTRDGLTYATAWGAEADGTWAEVSWGSGDGAVSPDDILKVCGAHVATTAITLGVSGATAGHETVINGDCTGDTGSITFSAAGYFYASRAYYELHNMPIDCYSTSNCINLTQPGWAFENVDLDGGVRGYSLDTSTGKNLGTTKINGGSISNMSVDGIRWLVTDAAVATIESLEITGVDFDTITQEAIHIRSEPDAPNALVSSLGISGCNFTNISGTAVRAFNAGSASTYGWGLVDAHDNDFDNIGGAFAVGGFGAAAYGTNKLYDNRIADTDQVTGGFDIFYCQYLDVYDNHIDGSTTPTIDGVGVLVDYGNNHVRVFRNEINNQLGKAGETNSGSAITVISSINIEFYYNYGHGNKNGIRLGPSNIMQVANIHGFNNTFWNIAENGIVTSAACDVITVQGLTLENNIFSGADYAVLDQSIGVGDIIEDYNDFYGFASGFSSHTPGANTVTVNPVLDAQGKPTVTSPVINSGAIIAGIHDQATPATDINGTSVLTIPDIGAYEYPGGLYFNASAADGGNGSKSLPYNTWSDYTWTGYNLRAGAQVYLQGAMTGTLDLSGLTDTGAKSAAVWPGKTGSVNGFVGGVSDALDLSGSSRGLFGTLYGN